MYRTLPRHRALCVFTRLALGTANAFAWLLLLFLAGALGTMVVKGLVIVADKRLGIG